MPTPEELLEALDAESQPLTDATPFFKGLFSGVMGSGKTVNAFRLAQLITPPDKTIEYIDSMEGWVSLDNHPEWDLKRRVNRRQFTGKSQLETLTYAILAKAGRYKDVGCIIVDEASTMADEFLETVTAAHAKKDTAKNPDEPLWPDYNVTKVQFGRVTTKMLKLPCHVIFLSHVREDKSKTGGIKIRPAFNPQLGGKLSVHFHIVGFASANEKTSDSGDLYERVVQINPTQTVDAKTRISFPGKVYVTWDELIQGVSEWAIGQRKELTVDETNSVKPVIEQIEEQNVESESEGIVID